MKKIMLIILGISIMLMLGCQQETFEFKGVIDYFEGTSVVVKVLEEDVASSSDLIWVYVGEDGVEKLKEGDTIVVEYDGTIMESYPAQVNEISVKKLDGTIIDITRSAVIDDGNDDETISITKMEATIISVEADGYIVEPVEGSDELASSNRIVVYTDKEFTVGDKVSILHDGTIMESDPAQINMESIELVE